MVSNNLMGYLVSHYDVDPLKNPLEYGYLVSSMTVIPCLISVPFFLYAGCKLRTLKRIKEKGMTTEQKKANRRRDTIMIRAVYGMDAFEENTDTTF
jgi:hypothetical protein